MARNILNVSRWALVAAGVFLLGSQSPAQARKGLKIPVGDDPSLKEGSPKIVLIEVSDFQ